MSRYTDVAGYEQVMFVIDGLQQKILEFIVGKPKAAHYYIERIGHIKIFLQHVNKAKAVSYWYRSQ